MQTISTSSGRTSCCLKDTIIPESKMSFGSYQRGYPTEVKNLSFCNCEIFKHSAAR